MQPKDNLLAKQKVKIQKAGKFLSFAFCLLPFAFFTACSIQKPLEKKSDQDTAANKAIETNFVFNDVTLEQADEQGRPLWKVKGKQANYSQDQKIALIENPDGNLFQDGKLVLRISAATGEVQEDGKKIFLKGKIVATDTRNGAVLRGEELEWYPQQDLLIVRNNFTGNRAQVQITGKEGRYLSRTQEMDLSGQIVATMKDPDLQIKTEHLIWPIPQEKIIGDKRIQISRYKGKNITDQVESDRSEVFLKTKIATLKQNVQLTSIDPPLLMASNSITWNLTTQFVVSDLPVKIVHQKEQITVTGNIGQLDLERKVALLIGGVQGVGTKNQAQLYANQLRWDIPSQQFEAEGNVIYQQVNPPLNLTGPRASGKMQNQTIVVSSTSGNRVVTEIIP